MTDHVERLTPSEEEAVLLEEASTGEQGSGKTEYIEFLGTDPRYGTEFYGAGMVGHTVTPEQLEEAWGVKTSEKLEWVKMAGGPHKGRMLVPVSTMSPEAAEGFENDPMFQRVSL